MALPRHALAPSSLPVGWEAFSHGSVPGSCWMALALLCWGGKGQRWHLDPSQTLVALSHFPSPALLTCPANTLQVFSFLPFSWEIMAGKDQSEDMFQGYKTEKWWFCPVWMKKQHPTSPIGNQSYLRDVSFWRFSLSIFNHNVLAPLALLHHLNWH